MTSTCTPELGDTITYNGERGEVIGFGSLAAAFPIESSETHHPSGFVVRVAMGRYGIERTLSLRELSR